MHIDAIYAWCELARALPFLLIVIILVHYFLRRSVWKCGRWLGWKRLGYYPSSLALGMALQFVQVFYQPSLDYVVEAKLDEQAEEDDNGDPETLARQLHRQLRRIRRGESVERLILQL